jgi:hypothetical protein
VIELLGEAGGVLVAGAILYAAKELRRIGDAVRDLDLRVSRMEHWMQRPGVQQRPGWSGDAFDTEVRSRGGKGGS